MSAASSPFEQFVHEYAIAGGARRFAVCEWNENASRYEWPLPKSAQKTSDCFGGFAQRPSASSWRYASRASAMSAARRLYGERVRQEAQEKAWDREALEEVRGETR